LCCTALCCACLYVAVLCCVAQERRRRELFMKREEEETFKMQPVGRCCLNRGLAGEARWCFKDKWRALVGACRVGGGVICQKVGDGSVGSE
jgi:hypothetical protein